MTINFKRSINTTILVSIPTLFGDFKCRPFKLLGVELPGVWLQSDELTAQLLSDQMTHYAATEPAVFVPFAQIAGIMVATTVPTAKAPSAATGSKAPAVDEETGSTAKSGRSGKSKK